MAFQGKTIVNTKTGQRTLFVQTSRDTGGQLLEMETTYRPHSQEPPPHYHPFQEEDFEILSGEITVRIDGATRVLKQGDRLHIPKNKVHSMWNHTDQPTTVNWQVRPAMDSEHFFETATGLANDGKTNAAGKPGFLQSVALARRFSKVFRPAKPPYAVQRVVLGVLGVVAWALGYRGTYRAYLD